MTVHSIHLGLLRAPYTDKEPLSENQNFFSKPAVTLSDMVRTEGPQTFGALKRKLGLLGPEMGPQT